MNGDASLTPEEVARILKIAKNTVYELVKRGDLSGYRVGRKLRIDLEDVEDYKKRQRKESNPPGAPASPGVPPCRTMPLQAKVPVPGEFTCYEPGLDKGHGLMICGQDFLLDVLARHLERHPRGTRVLRHHGGSFTGLLGLYQERMHMAGVHLWDGETDTYNIPYIRHLVPGVETVIIHLACRRQGFYVARGNPKKIRDWTDLTRPGLRFVNREKGSGTRVLLDEKTRLLKIDRQRINGYQDEVFSHLAVASTVARGDVDVGLGNEKTALQVRGLDFVPLQRERYDLVLRAEDMAKPEFQAVPEIIRSREFQAELTGLGDYDLKETGLIMAGDSPRG